MAVLPTFSKNLPQKGYTGVGVSGLIKWPSATRPGALPIVVAW
jgi:hypothetical protein